MVKIDFDFHVHTNYTDGVNSVAEIAERADLLGLRQILIPEHVRKKTGYVYSNLLSDIKDANEKFKVRIINGIEAKILDGNGTLDCPEEILDNVKAIIGSVHTLPKNMDYSEAYESLIKSECQIIGHPINLPPSLIPLVKKSKKILELNEDYPLDLNFIRECVENKIIFSVGSNAHNLDQIGNYSWVLNVVKKFSKEIKIWSIT